MYYLCHKSLRAKPLIIAHHALSVAFFPYATLQHRSLLLVLFFVVTDVTNVGQHLRILLQKLGYENSRAWLLIGLSWTGGFFFVRILPAPYFIYKMLYGSYNSFSA